MTIKISAASVLLICITVLAGCRGETDEPGGSGPSTLGEVPAVSLNFRYEADVPAPEIPAPPADERNAAVQNDFDVNRPQEVLDKTLTSPDKKRVLAVYHRVMDVQSEYRLDMYTVDGRILGKITPDTMAAHFPETIVWAPDSSTVAFVAMVRAGQEEVPGQPPAPETETPAEPTPDAGVNQNSAEGAGAISEANEAAEPVAEPTPAAPTGVLTFRTEQIYVCDAEGANLKPITQNEGLIYFYYTWSPDSRMLAALAATAREWQFLQYEAERAGQIFVPVGRPRLVEKNGRERRLDDGLTSVRPVWAPDSSKVAAAFDVQVRIYDAVGNNPTQAAVPLKNHLLLSSQAYDRQQQAALEAANTNSAPTPSEPSADGATTLPDEKSLVSYNPIVNLAWPSDDLLYFQTAFVKRMKNEAESVFSFARWHRLVLSPQPNR